MRTKPAVTDTIEGYCKLLGGAPVDVVTAARRFGMHLVDDKRMSVTFTPRDSAFASGTAVRRWGTNDLSGIDLDVEPASKLTFSKLRDAFGPFKSVRRMHPGDDYEFSAAWPLGVAKAACRIVVTLRAQTEHPTGNELVQRVSIARP